MSDAPFPVPPEFQPVPSRETPEQLAQRERRELLAGFLQLSPEQLLHRCLEQHLELELLKERIAGGKGWDILPQGEGLRLLEQVRDLTAERDTLAAELEQLRPSK